MNLWHKNSWGKYSLALEPFGLKPFGIHLGILGSRSFGLGTIELRNPYHRSHMGCEFLD